MKNYMQIINQKLNKAFGNTCTLVYVIDKYNYITGESEGVVEITRDLICDAPNAVDARLVDGKNYLAGDLILPLDYNSIVASRATMTSDPEIKINDVVKSLFTDLRPWTINDAGLDVGIDMITFGGTKYKIARVDGIDWINSQPAAYNLTLRV